MKIWRVSCFLAAILLSPSTHAQGRGSRRFDSTEVTPKAATQPNEDLARVDLPRSHRFDTRGQSRSSEVPLNSRPLSTRSRGFTSSQDQTSTTVSNINRRSGKDVRLSRNHNENLNQNFNTNEFSNSRSDSRRNNLKESYPTSRASSRLGNENENLNAKATEILERRSSSRSKTPGREFSSRSSTLSLNEQETLSTRESEISERRSTRRGKSSAVLAEVSTEFPSRRQSTITNIQDTSSQFSRTRSKPVKTDATEKLHSQPNEKLETSSSPSNQRSFTEVTTFPTRVTSHSSDEISMTEESIKLSPRTRNLNLENRNQASSSRSKSRSSSTDSVSKPTRNRNSEGRAPRIVEAKQDSLRAEKVRESARTRASDIGTVTSIRSREDISSTRTEKNDGKRGNPRTRTENEPRNIYRSRNTDSSGSRSISEGTQTGFSETESNIPRGRSRSKEIVNARSSSRLSNNNVGTTESTRSRSEDVGRVRSRNENIPRGTSRSRNEDTSRGSSKSKTEDENTGTLRTRNGSLRTRGKTVETERNFEPNVPMKEKKEELVLPQGEQVERSSIENLNSQIVEESNLPPASPSIPNQKETSAAEVNNIEVPNAQSENPIDSSSSNIGYEVQESTEPILELSSTPPEELVPNDGIKSNNEDEILSINSNDRKESSSKSDVRSDNSRSRSRDSSVRSSEDSLTNKEVLRIRNEKENKRTRFRSNDSDGVPVSTARGTSRGRISRTETSSVSDNSRRRKVPERSSIESQRLSDSRSQTGIDEIENGRTFQRDLIERRISSRKKDLTPDQTEVVMRSRFNSKNNIEELTQNYKKDIDTSNSSLRSIRFQSPQERNGKDNDLKSETKETSTKRSVEETLNARRSSFRNKVKEETDKSNETKTNRGRGTFKQTPNEKTADQEALLMARKKQRDAESKLSQTRFVTSAVTSSPTLLPRSLPKVQKRIPLDLKTEEDQVQPSIESPITPRIISSRQSQNPFRDLDPNLANPPFKPPLSETLQSSTSSPSSFYEKETEQIDGTENIKEKEVNATDSKLEDKQIIEQNNDEKNKVKSTRRKSGKYSAQYRRNNVLKETTESNINRTLKPTRNIPIARNPGRSQNELIARNFEKKESEKIVPVTPRFIPSSKTTNVPNVDKTEVESTTPIKPRYQLYMAKDRKKLLDRRLGGSKDGNPTGDGEDLDAKGYTLGNVESSTEKDGRWKRLKFGVASRPPYNPPRKSTSQLPTYTTTTQKSFSRFKSRKSLLLKNIGETDEIAFEASEDDNEPVTVKFSERIDLFSSPPPKLESANLITEIDVSTTASNLEFSSTAGQQSPDSPLLNTVFDGEPSTYSQQMTITPLTSTVRTPLKTLPVTKTTLTTTSKPVTITSTTSTISTTTTPSTTTPITTTKTPRSVTSTTTTTTTTPKTTTTTMTTPKTTTTATTPMTTTTTTTTPKPNTTPATPMTATTPKPTTTTTPMTTTTTPKPTTTTTSMTTTTTPKPTTTTTPMTTTTTPKTTTSTRRTTTTPKTTTSSTSTTTLKTTTQKTVSTPKSTNTAKPTSITPRKLSATKKSIPKTTTIKPVSIAIITPATMGKIMTSTKITTPKTVTKKPTPTTISTTKMPTTQKSKTIFRPQTTPMTIFSEREFSARSNSETLLSRSSIYSIDENPSPTVAPRTTRTPSPIPLSSYPTEPTLDLSSGDYVVYGLLPNRTLVRRVPSRTTTPQSELPFVVYGLYPNGTIVKKFPNGTVIPDDPPQEANELVANVDPFNRQELSDILERDRPLAYLYPTISTLTTMAPTTETIPTTTISTTTTTVKTTAATTKAPTPTKPSTTTVKPTTTKKPSTKKPVVVTTTTIKTSTIPSTTTTTTKPTVTSTTTKPTTTTNKPTTTTKKPTTTTKNPTTTKRPTTTKKPTTTTTTVKPTTTTTKKPTTTTKNPTTTKRPTTTTKKPTTTTFKPTTTKKPTTTTVKPTSNPITNTQNIISSTTTNSKNSDDVTIENARIQSTTDAQSRIVDDFALLNTLLQFQNEQSGNSIAPPFATPDSSVDDDDLANRIIQLAIERAQSTTESSDLQQVASASPAVEIESSSQLAPLDVDSSSPGGKISLWVVPEKEGTSNPKSPELTPQEEQVLNALLTAQRGSTPSSIRDQILLAELLGGAQSTTKRPRKKKKKPRPATTPRPPPFSGLAALISGLGSGNTQGQGGGLFGGRSPAQSAESDSLDVEEQPRNPGLLVTAAINITKAVSQFMGIVLQGAAQSFQSFVQTRTRALSDYLTYNGSNGG